MEQPCKAYIYAENGALLGFIAYTATPPQILELEGRYFEQRGTAREMDGTDSVLAFDYWEFDVVKTELDVVYICVGCGRNSSLTWHKCCPKHCTEEGPEVFCQSCVEKLHPGDPEFARE